MRWGSLRAGSPTGRRSGFIRQNYGRPDRRCWQRRRKGADGSQHLTTWSKSTRISEHAGKRRVGRSLSFIYAREQWTKCTFQGLNPFGFSFLSISLRPAYSQWRSLSEADRLFVFMLTYSVSNTVARPLQNTTHCLWFPSSEGKRSQLGLLGVGWGNSWEASSGCDTRPLLGGSSGSRFQMETMFVFTKHFRGKISPIWAEEAGYPHGLQLPVNMRQNNDSGSLKTSNLIDFLALLWHPVLLIDNCWTERKPKTFLFHW